MLTGSRIRARRLDLGLAQAALAATVGISASYLNLIEHNRRRIGGKLLADIARALDLDPGPLADGAGPAFVHALQEAAQGGGPRVAPLGGADDFAGRFPAWAGVVLDQAARIDRFQARIADLTARMTHDPQLAASLHDVISAVTAIRSSAAILVSGEGIDSDWQARFHRNINADARRLAETARGLVDYLERPETADEPRSPQEELCRWLDAQGWHLPQVEAGADIDLPGGVAGQLAAVWVAQYRADARALPLADFAVAAQAVGYDPVALAAQVNRPLGMVLRRLASLPPPHPAIGLAICDGSAGLLVLRTCPGFSLPRHAAACPLWPLYQALLQPGRPLRADVAMAGQLATPLRCHAIAEHALIQPDGAVLIHAVMLVQPGRQADHHVGATCRLCPQAGCKARREPSILGSGGG